MRGHVLPLDHTDQDLSGPLRVALSGSRATEHPDYRADSLVVLRSDILDLHRRPGPVGREAARLDDAGDVISTATSMAGALWQMAAPGTSLRTLYETRPELAHAVVDVQPQLTRILTALLTGICATTMTSAPFLSSEAR